MQIRTLCLLHYAIHGLSRQIHGLSAQTVDPCFVQHNPWIVQIHALCTTYTVLHYNNGHLLTNEALLPRALNSLIEKIWYVGMHVRVSIRVY